MGPKTLSVLGGFLSLLAIPLLAGKPYLVADIKKTVDGPAPGSSSPASFVVGKDRLFFIATSDDLTPYIYSSDGTESGTVPIIRLTDRINDLVPFAFAGGKLFMKKNRELWANDGTSSPPQLLNTVAVGTSCILDDHLFFFGNDGTTGWRIWATDGTPSGTRPVTNFATIDDRSPLTSLAGRLYFIDASQTAVDDFDPTTMTSRQIVQDRSRWFETLTPSGGSLYLTTMDATEWSLWRLSGAPADMALLAHGPALPVVLASIGAELLYLAGDSSGVQLWKTDGTPAGTSLVKNFGPNGLPPALQIIAVPIGDKALFVGYGSHYSVALWRTDGTDAGTVLLKDVPVDMGLASKVRPIVADGLLYYNAFELVHGHEPWETDGSPEGTMIVDDLEPGGLGSDPGPYARVGDRLFFTASAHHTGYELWALPLDGPPAVAIDDGRASATDSFVTLPIHLTHPWDLGLPVSYSTADFTAKAGTDYAESSGSITFAPGETSKMIQIPLVTNPTPGTRSFRVALQAPVAVERATGAAVIDGPPGTADLSVTLAGGGTGVTVTNSGPATATNVVLCIASTAGGGERDCQGPLQLAPNATFTANYPMRALNDTIVATATAWETDPNPSDNQLNATEAGSNPWVVPSVLRVGEHGTIVSSIVNPTLTVSDPSIIDLPQTGTPDSPRVFSAKFTALKPGTAIVSAAYSGGDTTRTSIRVLDHTEPAKAYSNVVLTANTPTNVWSFAGSHTVTAMISGMTADGAFPSHGTVSFLEDGNVIGTVPVARPTVSFTVRPSPGKHVYTATYSGDANFYDATSFLPVTINVVKSTPPITASRIYGTSNVLVIVHGVAGHAPSGTVNVFAGQTPLSLSGPLVARNDADSQVTALAVPSDRGTLTVSYSGDAFYQLTAPAVTIGGPHMPAAHH